LDVSFERRKKGVIEFCCGNMFLVWREKSWCRIGLVELELVIKKFPSKGSYSFFMGVIID